MWSRNLTRPVIRPGRPISRSCSASDISFGRSALGVKRLEAIDHVAGEILGARKAVVLIEAIVVGLEGIGDHQVARAIDGDPIGQLVVKAVAVIQKAAQFEMQPARVGARPSGHPADRTDTSHPLDRLDAEADMFAFDFRRHGLVVEPAIAVANDLVPILDKGARQLGVALGRLGDGQEAHLDPEAAEQAKQPPAADPRTVFEHGFDNRAAGTRH